MTVQIDADEHLAGWLHTLVWRYPATGDGLLDWLGVLDAPLLDQQEAVDRLRRRPIWRAAPPSVMAGLAARGLAGWPIS